MNELLTEQFDLKVEKLVPLEGYDSENYKVVSAERNFVLKIYAGDANLRGLLEAENEVLVDLATAKPESFQMPQKNSAGDFLTETEGGFARLLSFVEGDFFAEVEHTTELFFSLGKFLAEMNGRFASFRRPAIEARKFGWDLKFYYLNKNFLPFIENPAERTLVEYFFLQHRERVEPFIEDLRFSLIHNDANDWNILTRGGEVAGLIDFGDMCYSPLINELAITLTYAVMGKENPIERAIPIIDGYNKTLALQEKEVELLYWLIATRLCISVCNSAKAKREKPDSEYITISEKPAWKLLKKWVSFNPLYAEDEFRKACGLASKIKKDLEADLAKRHSHTSKALSLQFEKPIKMVGAAFQYMFDAAGKSYLDCYNNIPQVGHCHPRVVRAGQKAMSRLNTNTRYLNDAYNAYAENLLQKFPEELNKLFFVNSGSAASDLAIRLALAHTKNQGIVVVEHGYHGNTRLGIEISHYKYNRPGGKGKTDAIIEAEIPDSYKGRFTENDGTAGLSYAESLFARINENAFAPAAFIAEPIVGCGGQIPLATGYLKTAYPLIRDAGGVCISDEVQTGFGRLGKYFWGFEMHEVVPDIVVLGKPMGNGHPIAAVVTTDEITTSFETGMEFFSSFGGNTVSCAIGQAVLDVLENENLPANAEAVGGHLLGLFKDLVEKYEACGDARGEGLFLGLELVKDKQSKSPNSELAAIVKNKLRERNILIGTDGPFDNVLKIKPPICFTKQNADELAGNIDEIFQRLQ